MLSKSFYLVTVICALSFKFKKILRFAHGVLMCVFSEQ